MPLNSCPNLSELLVGLLGVIVGWIAKHVNEWIKTKE